VVLENGEIGVNPRLLAPKDINSLTQNKSNSSPVNNNTSPTAVSEPNNARYTAPNISSNSSAPVPASSASAVPVSTNNNGEVPDVRLVNGVMYINGEIATNQKVVLSSGVLGSAATPQPQPHSADKAVSNNVPATNISPSPNAPIQPNTNTPISTNDVPIKPSSSVRAYQPRPITGSPVSGGHVSKILLADLYGEDTPCDAHYNYNWHTSNIHAYKYNLAQMPDTIVFFLTHGLGDDFRMPVIGRVTSNFGPRRRRFHNGIDLKLQTGDNVYSVFDGKVRIAQYSRSYGYVVVIRHYNGLETFYAHLSKLKVKAGDKIEAGEVLGLGGSTGRSTGPHLHFEIRYKGHPIDPNEMIDFNYTQNLRSHTFTVDKSYFSSSTPYQSSHGTGSSSSSSSSSSGAKYYTVRRGDTLGKIAKRNGTSVSRLCKLNRMSSRSTLRVGKRLRVR
jgi:murein DD-endopeptidase MepM/ murein hydrolase activator NlpD